MVDVQLLLSVSWQLVVKENVRFQNNEIEPKPNYIYRLLNESSETEATPFKTMNCTMYDSLIYSYHTTHQARVTVQNSVCPQKKGPIW
jgi:hypothetical protein